MVEEASLRIFRIFDTSEGFACTPRKLVQDKALSHASRGLLEEILSMPEDWVIRLCMFKTEHRGGGRDGIRRMMSELRRRRYASYVTVRGVDGRFRSQYFVFADPSRNRIPDGCVITQVELDKILQNLRFSSNSPETASPAPAEPVAYKEQSQQKQQAAAVDVIEARTAVEEVKVTKVTKPIQKRSEPRKAETPVVTPPKAPKPAVVSASPAAGHSVAVQAGEFAERRRMLQAGGVWERDLDRYAADGRLSREELRKIISSTRWMDNPGWGIVTRFNEKVAQKQAAGFTKKPTIDTQAINEKADAIFMDRIRSGRLASPPAGFDFRQTDQWGLCRAKAVSMLSHATAAPTAAFA